MEIRAVGENRKIGPFDGRGAHQPAELSVNSRKMADNFRQAHHRETLGADDRVNSRVSHPGSCASKEVGTRMSFGERGNESGGVEVAGRFSGGNQNSKSHYNLVYQHQVFSRRATTNLCYTEITRP
jgi:hypothetical protein